MVAVSGSRVAPRRHARHSALDGLAKFGFAARGVVYLLIGWVALLIATGHKATQANQRGAMAEVTHHHLGWVVVLVLGVGLAAYALWSFTEVVFGVAGEGNKAGARAKAFLRGLTYSVVAFSTFAFLAGSRESQDQQQQTMTARLMRHTDGRWIVGLAGVVVIVIGAVQAWDGLRRKFEKQLKMDELTGRTRSVVVGMGVVGSLARGLVFLFTGIFVVDAAWTFNALKSAGLDGALRTLAAHPYGQWLLGVLSLGLVIFGLFSVAMTRWGKTSVQ